MLSKGKVVSMCLVLLKVRRFCFDSGGFVWIGICVVFLCCVFVCCVGGVVVKKYLS